MTLRAPMLLVAGILLLATAGFHLTGWTDAASWIEGGRGRIVSLLWFSAAAGWIAVAAFWIHGAFAPSALSRSAVLATAVIPLVVAIPLLVMVSPLHPGGYMLALSSLLAVWGAKRHF